MRVSAPPPRPLFRLENRHPNSDSSPAPKFAKLIIAIIIAHFVSAVDFEAVDEGGKVVTEQPGMSREGVAPVRKDVVRLRFRVRDSAISRAEAVSS